MPGRALPTALAAFLLGLLLAAPQAQAQIFDTDDDDSGGWGGGEDTDAGDDTDDGAGDDTDDTDLEDTDAAGDTDIVWDSSPPYVTGGELASDLAGEAGGPSCGEASVLGAAGPVGAGWIAVLLLARRRREDVR